MKQLEKRPFSRGRRQENRLYLTDLSRGASLISRPLSEIDEEEPDPPRKYLEPHEIKIKLYLKECEKLNVIPISAYIRHPTKNALQIRHYNIGPNGARALAAALILDTAISYLDIEGNSITPIGLAGIQEALTENMYITHLSIADNKLGSQGAALIGLMMKTNHTIEILNASRNGFRDTDAPIFAKILKENRTLKELIVAGNEFEEIAGIVFGQALSTNDTLERLDVSWNNIRKRGAQEFAQGLKENVALRKLNASFNGFGTEGAAFLAQALITNRTLTDLDISKNRITDIDVKILSKQLSVNETLKVLRIGDNLMTPLGAMEILRAVQCSEVCSLETIDFGTTSVDLGFEMILKELQEVKNVKVIYGRVQNVYADKTMEPVPEPTERVVKTVLGDTETAIDDDAMDKTEKGKTYVVDEGDSDAKQTEGLDNENRNNGQVDNENNDSTENNGADVEGDSETNNGVTVEKSNKGEKMNTGTEDEGVDFDEKKLDDEIEAVTGKPEQETQVAIYTERASVGTMTPDI